MTSVWKSPNMMSMTGRSPVIAAPRPRPVIPASEIGESITRSAPNSSTSPDVTLNGVPASATSSPIRNTVGSRRSSSASASLTACASVSSRRPSEIAATSAALGEDILVDLARLGERCLEGVAQRRLDLGRGRGVDTLELLGCGDAALEDPGAVDENRVTLRRPERFLVLGAVVRAVDVADV